LEVGIDRIFDVIEKGFEAGIAIAFGGLFGSVSELGINYYLTSADRFG
jgi:hypothetical protein